MMIIQMPYKTQCYNRLLVLYFKLLLIKFIASRNAYNKIQIALWQYSNNI